MRDKGEERKSSNSADSDYDDKDWFEVELSEDFEDPSTPRFDKDDKESFTITDVLMIENPKPQSPSFESKLIISF